VRNGTRTDVPSSSVLIPIVSSPFSPLPRHNDDRSKGRRSRNWCCPRHRPRDRSPSRRGLDGYDIALNDLPAQEAVLRVTAEEVASRGRRVHCVLADVSSEIQVQTMVSDVVRVLGGLDVVGTTFPGTL
jgi:hypothetical protein